MTDHPSDAARRSLLQTAAGLAAGALSLDTRGAAATTPAAPPGKSGEFDFLAGEWKISHRRLIAERNEWDTFAGEATCWTLLGGAGSIEELRIPARNFAGLGIRLLDVKQRVWCDYWVNARDGVLSTPGMTGAFVDGVGTFTAEETEGGKTMLVRGVWDRITRTSCRWHQASSRDGGKTWAANWYMEWSRA